MTQMTPMELTSLPPSPTEAVPLVALDANALDRDGSPRDALVDRLEALAAAGRLRLFVPAGVLAEMRAPGAPEAVRAAASRLPTLPALATASAPGAAPRPPTRLPAPTARQHIDRIRVRAIMRGDGRPGKHDADASHLSEAAEAGCDAFLTRDGKVLRRRDVLRQALPPGLRIATLEEFLSGPRRGEGGEGSVDGEDGEDGEEDEEDEDGPWRRAGRG